MKINKDKLKIYGPIIIVMSIITGIFLGIVFTNLNLKNIVYKEITKQNARLQSPHNFNLAPKNDKISSAIYYVINDYVDSVPLNEINEEVIPAVLKNLDPHSVYIPAQDFSKYNEPLKGNFSGIGVSFNMVDDTVAIINTIPNGPSENVGILPGDRIIVVDSIMVAGVKMPSDDIVSKLKGIKGTSVTIKVLRRGQTELLEFEIIRDDIPLYSVDVHYMINEEIGYVKISTFAQTTYREFLSAVQDLKTQGMKKIILDLRSNGGGVMDAAINIADQFLSDQRLIVYTEGRSRQRQNEYASSKGLLKDDDVVILLDEFAASASEILAGAIQDNDRGLIVGRRSFGKGLVQEQMSFADGSAIRLTVAKYYTPTGRSIQKSYENGRDEYYNDLSYRYMHGEFENADSIKFADSLKFVTPGGKTVYGGGGIMPDIFVPVDTTFYTPYLSKLTAKGLTYRFAFQYTDQHREDLKPYTNANDISAYLDKQALKKEFIKFAEENGIKTNYSEFAISEEYILTQIKAYIARNTIDNIGFYPIVNQLDVTLSIAVDTLKSL